MITYFLRCKKDIENINLLVSKTKNSRTMLSSKCAICGSKKSRLMKEQKVKGLLNSLQYLT